MAGEEALADTIRTLSTITAQRCTLPQVMFGTTQLHGAKQILGATPFQASVRGIASSIDIASRAADPPSPKSQRSTVNFPENRRIP